MFVAGMQHCWGIQRAFDFDGGTSPGDAPGDSISTNNHNNADGDGNHRHVKMVIVRQKIIYFFHQFWAKYSKQRVQLWIMNISTNTKIRPTNILWLYVNKKDDHHHHTFQLRTKVKIIEKRFVTFPGCKYLQADRKPDPKRSNWGLTKTRARRVWQKRKKWPKNKKM